MKAFVKNFKWQNVMMKLDPEKNIISLDLIKKVSLLNFVDPGIMQK